MWRAWNLSEVQKKNQDTATTCRSQQLQKKKKETQFTQTTPYLERKGKLNNYPMQALQLGTIKVVSNLLKIYQKE